MKLELKKTIKETKYNLSNPPFQKKNNKQHTTSFFIIALKIRDHLLVSFFESWWICCHAELGSKHLTVLTFQQNPGGCWSQASPMETAVFSKLDDVVYDEIENNSAKNIVLFSYLKFIFPSQGQQFLKSLCNWKAK